MGFIRRTDIRNTNARAGWTPWPGWPGIRNLDFSGGVDYFENHLGIVESRTENVGFGFTRRDNSRFRISAEREFDLLTSPFRLGPSEIGAGGYTWDSWNVSYNTDQSRRIYGGGRFNTGGYCNGERTSFSGDIAFLPLETLLVEIDYTRNHITTTAFSRYVTNTVNARVSHSFTPDLFVKSFMQYNDARQLANLNLLVWYRYLTGSDLYIVYNQGWNTDLAGPDDLSVRDRSLQVKLTYWWAR